MTYEGFVMDFTEELSRQLEKDHVVLTRQEIIKVNETRDSMIIGFPGRNEKPIIYLEEEFRMYQDGHSVQEVAQWAAQRTKDIYYDIPDLSEINAISARQNLYCVVINAEANQDLLDHCVHEKMEDLAILARFRMGENASMAVTYDACSQLLQMTSSEVLEIAHANTDKSEYQYINLHEYISGKIKQDANPAEYIDDTGFSPPLYIVTNTSGVDGAVAIASRTAMDKAYDILGENFYVLPSSRHEVIVIPDSYAMAPAYMEEMVKDVNKSEVSISDQLSNHVYHYDSTRKKVSLVDCNALSAEKDPELSDTKKHARCH